MFPDLHALIEKWKSIQGGGRPDTKQLLNPGKSAGLIDYLRGAVYLQGAGSPGEIM